jgi:transposase
MRRTEALQGVRMAVFLNLLSRWESAELSQEEAAELLGVSERTFRRWTRAYEEEGEAGLVDRRLGKASGKRVPADRAEEVKRLYRERYQGFTVKHFHEHLIKDHGFGWGYTWTKLHLQWTGAVPKAPRKGAHRRKRERSRCASPVRSACCGDRPVSHSADEDLIEVLLKRRPASRRRGEAAPWARVSRQWQDR